MSQRTQTKSKKTRAAVNRANAQKSTGPKTEQGKAASSQNSFKHGLYSKAIIIPGEDPASSKLCVPTSPPSIVPSDSPKKCWSTKLRSRGLCLDCRLCSPGRSHGNESRQHNARSGHRIHSETARVNARDKAAENQTTPPTNGDPQLGTYRLDEGTILETVLLNRLDGEFGGPVITQMANDVYSRAGLELLIPKARGFSAKPVKSMALISAGSRFCFID